MNKTLPREKMMNKKYVFSYERNKKINLRTEKK